MLYVNKLKYLKKEFGTIHKGSYIVRSSYIHKVRKITDDLVVHKWNRIDGAFGIGEIDTNSFLSVYNKCRIITKTKYKELLEFIENQVENQDLTNINLLDI